jgi:VWFA-related protein
VRFAFQWLPAFCAAALLACPFTTAVHAQSAPTSFRIVEARNVGGTTRVIAAVTDAGGRSVRDLSAANFQVQIDGTAVQPLVVERIGEPGQPLSVMLLVDVSGSLQGPAIDNVRRALSALVDQLEPDDYCALSVFGSGVRHLVEFTRERQRVRDAIQKLAASDARTHLYQGVLESLERAVAAPSGRTAIVALTDGKDEGSAVQAADVIQRATATGIPLYMLAFGSQADVDLLRRLATLTRGGFYSTPDPSGLPAIYKGVGDQLKDLYLLSFATPSSGRGNLSVTVTYRGQSLTAVHAPGTSPDGSAAPVVEPRSTFYRWSIWLGAAAVFVLVGGLVVASRRRMTPELARTVVVPKVWLEVVKGPDTGVRWPLAEQELTIGRSPGSRQLALKNDPMAGRNHARIRQNENGRYVLEDLASQNGTTVNGIAVTKAVLLQGNDRIGLGVSEILFVDNR